MQFLKNLTPALIILMVFDSKYEGTIGRAATFTPVNGTVSCFCNKHLQNWPTIYTNFPCDQRPGLLIAFSYEHPALDHQTVCLFSQIRLYLIKYLLQLELQRTCSTDSIL